MGFVRHLAKRGPVGLSQDDVTISLVRNTANANTSRAMCFRLSQPVMHKLGWLAGDRVFIGFGEGRDDGCVQITKANGDAEGSYCLSATGHGVSGRGKCISGTARMCPTQSQINMIFPKYVRLIRPAFEVGDNELLLNCREPHRPNA